MAKVKIKQQGPWERRTQDSRYHIAKTNIEYILNANKSPDGKEHRVKINYSVYHREWEVSVDGRTSTHRYQNNKRAAMKKATQLRRSVVYRAQTMSKGRRPHGKAISVAIFKNDPKKSLYAVSALRTFAATCKALTTNEEVQVRLSRGGITFRTRGGAGQIIYHIPASRAVFIRSRGAHSFEMDAQAFGKGLAWILSEKKSLLIFQTGPTGVLRIANQNLNLPAEYMKPSSGRHVTKIIKMRRIGNTETAKIPKLWYRRLPRLAHLSKGSLKGMLDSFAKEEGAIRIYVTRKTKKTDAQRIIMKGKRAEVSVTPMMATNEGGKAIIWPGDVRTIQAMLKMHHAKGRVMLFKRPKGLIVHFRPLTKQTKTIRERSMTLVYYVSR